MKERTLSVHFSIFKLVFAFLTCNLLIYVMFYFIYKNPTNLIKPVDPVFTLVFSIFLVPIFLYQLYLYFTVVELYEHTILVTRFSFLIKVHDIRLISKILEFNTGSPSQKRIEFNAFLFKNGDLLYFPGSKKDWKNLNNLIIIVKEYVTNEDE